MLQNLMLRYLLSVNLLFNRLSCSTCYVILLPPECQFSAIVHYSRHLIKSFDCNPTENTKRTFLDISKAFDKVRHEGLIFELQSDDIEVNLLILFKNYLEDGKKRVVEWF